MSIQHYRICSIACVLGAAMAFGCEGDLAGDDSGDNESEVITTVTLSFVPQGGGDAVVARFSDPDGDGGISGSSEEIVLTSGTNYDLSIAFTNELDEPPEDITVEIEEESEAHQIFITGQNLSGAAQVQDTDTIVMQAYADRENDYGGNLVGDDLPVGLRHTITAVMPGTGTFEVRLQHLPELNGEPQKVAGLAEMLGAGMPLPGQADVAVTFELSVQ